MNRCVWIGLGIACALFSIVGCGSSSATGSASGATSKFHLASEPAGAVEVLVAKDLAQDGEAVVVVGRLGGGVKPWIDGRAAFLLVDTRMLPACDEGGVCQADCPHCAKEMLAASTMVKFLGTDGKVLPVDARELLGVKEQQTVVVHGIASRDNTGNVSITAEGIFVRR